MSVPKLCGKSVFPTTHSERGNAMKQAKMSRRHFLQIIGVGSGALALAACTPVAVAPGSSQSAEQSAPAAAKVDLAMWKMPHKPNGEEVAIAQKVLDGFQQRNPDI